MYSLSGKLIIANWKMNGTMSNTNLFIEQLKDFYSQCNVSNTCVICPPYTILHMFGDVAKHVFLGAQHCSPNEAGAYTGDISAAMLAEVGCKFVIVAHSERRQYFNETYRVAKHQCLRAIDQGITPILCLGEENREDAEGALLDQMQDVCMKELDGRVVAAYEPIWAIGGAVKPDIDHIIRAISLIKKVAPNTAIIYGGSVNSNNADEVLGISDGVLVGGTSLDCNRFCKILSYGM